MTLCVTSLCFSSLVLYIDPTKQHCPPHLAWGHHTQRTCCLNVRNAALLITTHPTLRVCDRQVLCVLVTIHITLCTQLHLHSPDSSGMFKHSDELSKLMILPVHDWREWTTVYWWYHLLVIHYIKNHWNSHYVKKTPIHPMSCRHWLLLTTVQWGIPLQINTHIHSSNQMHLICVTDSYSFLCLSASEWGPQLCSRASDRLLSSLKELLYRWWCKPTVCQAPCWPLAATLQSHSLCTLYPHKRWSTTTLK